MCVRFNLLKIREYFRKLFALVSCAVPVTTLKAYSRLSTETYTSVVYGKHMHSRLYVCVCLIDQRFIHRPYCIL